MALAVVGHHTLCHILWTYSSLLQAEMVPCCYGCWSRVRVGNHEMEFVIKMHEKPASHTTPVPLKSVSTGQMAQIDPHLHVHFIALCPCPCKWSRRSGGRFYIASTSVLCLGIPAHASIKQQYDSFYRLPLMWRWRVELCQSPVYLLYTQEIRLMSKTSWNQNERLACRGWNVFLF